MSNVSYFPDRSRDQVPDETPRGAQLEDGYTRIADTLLDALCIADFTAREFRVVNFIIRQTYGWNCKAKRMSASFIAPGTGLHESDCSKVLNELIRRNVVLRHGGSRSPVSLNKHVELWEASENSKKQAPIKRPESGQDALAESGQDALTKKDRKDKRVLSTKEHVVLGKKSSTKSQPYPEEFEACWKAYPKRHSADGKKPAFKAWQARVRSGVLAETLLLATTRYAKQCHQDGSIGTRFVKMASTFYGPDEHWESFDENWKPESNPKTKPASPIAQTSMDGRQERRPLPGLVDQPDDDGFLTFPSGSRWHVQDWMAGRVTDDGQPAEVRS